MSSKNGCDYFHWVLTYFALKMEFFWKSDKERRTLWFWWFCCSWLVKRTCILNCTYMWSKCIHSWGTRVCLLGFGSIVSIVLSCKMIDKLCQKWSLGPNTLQIFCYDVYCSVMYFLLYLDCEKLYEVLKL
jgi:hypothetical protein